MASGDVKVYDIVNGDIADGAAIDIDKTAQRPNLKYMINPLLWRQPAAMHTPLSNAASGSNLELTTGTFGTGVPTVQTGDVKASTTSRSARMLISIPGEWMTGESLSLAAMAGMLTSISDNLATIDFQAYKVGDDSLKSGSDLVNVAAQSINSLSFAQKTFTLDTSTLSPGDWIDLQVTIAVTDAATVTAVKACLAWLKWLCDIRG